MTWTFSVPGTGPSEPAEVKAALGSALVLAAGGILSTALAQVASVAVIVAFVLAVSRKPGGPVGSGTLFDAAVAILVLSRLVSIGLSVEPSESLRILRTEIPFYLLSYGFLWAFRRSGEMFSRTLVTALVAGALVAAITGVVLYATGMRHRAESFTSGYYTLGMYLTAIFGLVLGIGPRREYFRNALIYYAILALLLVGVLFTFNRVHWVICGVLVLIVGVARERKLLLAMAAVMVIAVLASEPLQQRVFSLVTPTEMLTDRDVIWREALKLAGDRPLTGFGPRSFHTIFPEVSEPIDPKLGSWHNDMLQLYLESGGFAVAGYLGFMLVPVFLGARHLIRTRDFRDPLLQGFVLVPFSVWLGGLAGIFHTDPVIFPLSAMSVAMVLWRVNTSAGALKKEEPE